MLSIAQSAKNAVEFGGDLRRLLGQIAVAAARHKYRVTGSRVSLILRST